MAEPSVVSEAEPVSPEQLARRAKIAALEESIAHQDPAHALVVADVTRHYFASGVYCREARIPAGATVVGKIHRTQHLAILLKGRVAIATEGQAEPEIFDAPRIMVAPAGIKRVAHALTDTIWLAFHAVDEERDLAKIEQRFIAPTWEALEDPEPQHVLEAS